MFCPGNTSLVPKGESHYNSPHFFPGPAPQFLRDMSSLQDFYVYFQFMELNEICGSRIRVFNPANINTNLSYLHLYLILTT
jgi:hypothetical protein